MSFSDLHISNPRSEVDLLSQLRGYGQSVPGRTSGRKTTDCERWGMRALILHMYRTGELPNSVKIEHITSGSSLPDFRLSSDRTTWHIEFTEVCPAQDGREMALAEKSNRVSLLGEFGGAGFDGFRGDEQIRLIRQQISHSIEAKRRKFYQIAPPIDLLLYINMNASFGLPVQAMKQAMKQAIECGFDHGQFRNIFCIWAFDPDTNRVEISSLRPPSAGQSK